MEPKRDATNEETRALASSLRMRILRICLSEPRTNKEIATVLGRDPATTLHHVRQLTKTGFLAAQEPRRGARGAKEIPYLATRKSWTLNVPAKSAVLLEAFLEEVALTPAQEVVTARLGVRLKKEDLERVQDRIAAVFDEIAQMPDDPEGEAWSLFYATHPDPNRRP